MLNSEKLGHIEISKQAIESIIGIATIKTKGVHSIQGLLKSSLVSNKLVSKGVTLIAEDDSYSVNIFVALKYGVNIKETAQLIQNRIKEQVMFMCNVEIKSVNVFVTKLIFETGEQIG